MRELHKLRVSGSALQHSCPLLCAGARAVCLGRHHTCCLRLRDWGWNKGLFVPGSCLGSGQSAFLGGRNSTHRTCDAPLNILPASICFQLGNFFGCGWFLGV